MLDYKCPKKTRKRVVALMRVSKEEIKPRIEQILSDILSDKYEAKVSIKFEKSEDENDGDGGKSRNLKK